MDATARRDFVLCLAMATLLHVTTVFFNGALASAQAVLADSARDWATAAQAIGAVALAFVARRWPHAVRADRITPAMVICLVAGTALAVTGYGLQSAVLVIVGGCGVALAVAWAWVLLLLLYTRLSFRAMIVCIAVAELVAIPLAFVLSVAGYLWVQVFYALCVFAVLIAVTYQTREVFERIRDAEAAVDAEVTRPDAVLPLNHSLFVYIFAFSFAYGFGLRYEHADGGLVASWFIVVVLAAVGLYAWKAPDQPEADRLFDVACVLLLGGFVLALLNAPQWAPTASAVLVGSETLFNVLMLVVLTAVAARSRSIAILVGAWGYAAYYAGIETGAQLGIAVTGLASHDALAAQSIVGAILVLIVGYVLFSRRAFGFDQTIAGVELDAPSVPVVEIQYADTVGSRIEELAVTLGLTEREADVFRLLARGNNTLHIQEELAITKNTLKYHVRHIYTKANVHSQQELIDLL